MVWVWAVVLVVIIGGIVVVASGRGGSLAEVYDDRADAVVTAGRPLTAEDLRAVRLSTGFRGYRMDEVDALLDRIAADLLAREGRAAQQRPEPAAEPGRPPGGSERDRAQGTGDQDRPADPAAPDEGQAHDAR
ncbi:MAG TPA: DivIVA domain-containing protein [Nocardioidaceae bacterium]|nr:DivIVA domain-containing protein [Nocardioidaceae bacterium]